MYAYRRKMNRESARRTRLRKQEQMVSLKEEVCADIAIIMHHMTASYNCNDKRQYAWHCSQLSDMKT